MSKQGIGTVIGVFIAIALQAAPRAPRYTASAAGIIAGACAVWWAYRHFSEDRPLAGGKFAATTGAIVIGTLAWAVWTWPAGIVVYERYAGQWPGYTDKNEVKLNQSVKLVMGLYQTQRLFPAPSGGSIALSNVLLDVCVPMAFNVLLADPKIWQRADDDNNECEGGARWTTHIPQVSAGDAVNPAEPLTFIATAQGTYSFRWRASATELSPAHEYFPITVVRR